MTTSIGSVQQPSYIKRNNPFGYASAADVEQALQGAKSFQVPVSAPATAQGDTFVRTTTAPQPQSDNGCTDEKDDGHISFWSKLGHAIKGVGKSIVKGIKGMFTNSEGKFSLGKTLLSIGTIAASVAFPAVGLALCTVGAVSGAVQVGKGIKHACSATTDAEAKDAWENIGGGTFQVATSVAGAKASFNAMKASSTAANGLNSLSKGASWTDKAKAFAADAKSSTVNRYNAITGQASTLLRRAEITHTFKKQNPELQAAELADAKSRLQALETAGDTSSAEYQNVLREIEIRETYAENGLKADFSALKGQARATASKALNNLKNINFRKNFNVSALSQKAQNAYAILTTKGYSQAVTQCGYETVAQLMSVIAAVDMETTD